MEKLMKTADTLWRLWARAACFFMAFVIGFIVVNIILRRFFNAPIFGSTEIICFSVLFTSSFALAYCEWVDGNIRIALLLEMASEKVRMGMMLIVNIACTIGLIVCCYLLVNQTISKYVIADTSFSLKWPLWIFYLALSVGFILFTLTFVVKAILTLHCVRQGLPMYDLKAYAASQIDEDMLE